MKSETKFEKPTDLKNWAYQSIKELILNFKVKPDEQLKIEDLSSKMGISRTPIREALLRLEHEGLVRAASRVGFFVRGITKQDLNELFEIREITESYAAEKTAPLLNDEDLKEIEMIHAKSLEAVKKGELLEFNTMEIHLHTFIIKHSQNTRLFELIQSLKDLTYRERILALESIENVKQSLNEHQKIVEALKKRDGKLAGELMRDHIQRVKHRLLDYLDLPEGGE